MKIFHKTRFNFLNQPSYTPKKSVPDVIFIGMGINSSYNDFGVEKAPDAIRQISFRYSNADGSSYPLKIFNPELGMFPNITFADMGNLILPKSSKMEKIIKSEMGKINETTSFPVIIGGDHYISYPIISAYDQKMTVVHFDSHGDFLNEPSCLHGSVMRYVSKLPNVQKIIHCGLRGNLNTGPGLEDSLKQGNKIFVAGEIQRDGKNLLMKELSSTENVYITFDIDFLDPSIAYATGFPEPGGADYNLARDLLCSLAKNKKILGIDFVEYNPTKDLNEVTGIHITNLLIDFLSTKFKGKDPNVRNV